MLFFGAMANVKGECRTVRERIAVDIKSENKIPERVRDVLGPNYNTNPIVLLHSSCVMLVIYIYIYMIYPLNKVTPSTTVAVVSSQSF